MKRVAVVAVVVSVVAGAAPLAAWGVTAHRVINRVAVNTLPGDVPPFVKRQIDWIGVRSVTPDSWRIASEPFLKIEEDPNHGWFLEQFAFMHEIPRSRYEFVLALYDEYLRIKTTDPERAALTNVRWTGTLPYAAVETYERIKVTMRSYRAAVAEKQDTQFIEMDAAFYIGWLGHYAADGAMPLHTSVHHDGWQGANPKNYTTDPRVHGRFESQFVDLIQLSDSGLADQIGKSKTLDDPFTAILAHLDDAATHVEEVYVLDKSGALADKSNEPAAKLVKMQLGKAAALLRDLAYTAWIESGKAQPTGSPQVNPISRTNPRYNPETGTAAPKPAVKR